MQLGTADVNPGTHECVFPEEQEAGGRLILAPCLTCGLTALDALAQLREDREAQWTTARTLARYLDWSGLLNDNGEYIGRVPGVPIPDPDPTGEYPAGWRGAAVFLPRAEGGTETVTFDYPAPDGH